MTQWQLRIKIKNFWCSFVRNEFGVWFFLGHKTLVFPGNEMYLIILEQFHIGFSVSIFLFIVAVLLSHQNLFCMPVKIFVGFPMGCVVGKLIAASVLFIKRRRKRNYHFTCWLMSSRPGR